MAAITGLDKDSKPLNASFSCASFFSTTRSLTAANSLTSEPAQNALSPAPVTTTARTASSRSSSWRASISCLVISSVTRLSGGLLSVSFATPSSRRSTRTSRLSAGLDKVKEPGQPHYECSVRRCRGVQRLANPAYLSGFLFSWLQRVAPYCVPGGVKVVSISHRCPPSSKGYFRQASESATLEGSLSSTLVPTLGLASRCKPPEHFDTLLRGAQAELSGVVSIDPAVCSYQPRCGCRRRLPSTGSPAAIHAFLPSSYSRTFV